MAPWHDHLFGRIYASIPNVLSGAVSVEICPNTGRYDVPYYYRYYCYLQVMPTKLDPERVHSVIIDIWTLLQEYLQDSPFYTNKMVGWLHPTCISFCRSVLSSKPTMGLIGISMTLRSSSPALLSRSISIFHQPSSPSSPVSARPQWQWA